MTFDKFNVFADIFFNDKCGLDGTREELFESCFRRFEDSFTTKCSGLDNKFDDYFSVTAHRSLYNLSISFFVGVNMPSIAPVKFIPVGTIKYDFTEKGLDSLSQYCYMQLQDLGSTSETTDTTTTTTMTTTAPPSFGPSPAIPLWMLLLVALSVSTVLATIVFFSWRYFFSDENRSGEEHSGSSHSNVQKNTPVPSFVLPIIGSWQLPRQVPPGTSILPTNVSVFSATGGRIPNATNVAHIPSKITGSRMASKRSHLILRR